MKKITTRRAPWIALWCLAAMVLPQGCDEPLDGAAVATQAVTGTITPSAAVGALSGDITVGADGSAHLALPIATPTGRGGIEPSLSLEYSSRTANGPLGMGWSLRGLSSITRCGNRFSRDGMSRPVRFDSLDNYCLDGALLVLVSGDEFRAEDDSGARVLRDGTDAEGPTSWTVYAHDGRILHYGEPSATGARVDAYRTLNGDDVRPIWALDRVEDRSGNTMVVKYNTATLFSAVTQEPSEIDYTGNGTALPYNRKVLFQYETRTDRLTQFVGGLGFLTTDRLAHIVTQAPSTAGGTTSTTVATYNLSYTSSASTGRSILASVELCTDACLPKTTFTYTSAPPSFTKVTGTVGDTAHPFTANLNSNAGPNDGEALRFADLDGDGNDDMLYWNGAWNVRWASHPGSTPGFPSAPAPQTNVVSSKPLGTTLYVPFSQLYDVDGDNKVDLLTEDCAGVNQESQCQLKIYLSTASGFATASSKYALGELDTSQRGVLMDLNGDGAPDWASNTNLARFWIPSATPATPGWSAAYNSGGTLGWRQLSAAYTALGRNIDLSHDVFRDIDGDGQPELLAAWKDISNNIHFDVLDARGAASANGAVTLVDVTPDPIGATFDPCDVWADVNGDGLPDIVHLARRSISVNFGNHYFIEAGPKFSPPNPMPLCNNAAGIDVGLRVADYNGDGKQDVLIMGKTSTAAEAMRVLQADADGDTMSWVTGPIATLGSAGQAGTAHTYTGAYSKLLDVNGDGLYDLFQVTDQSGDYELYVQQGTAADLLFKVDHGVTATQTLGLESRVTYAPLTQSYAAASCAHPAFPNRCYIGPLYVVTTEYIDTGSGAAPSTFSVTHDYQDARIDVQGEGFLGFATHTTTDSRNGAKLRTTYDFATNQPYQYPNRYRYPHQSKPIATLAYVSDGKWHAREVLTTYKEKATFSGGGSCATRFTYARAIEDRVFELASAPLDASGNINTTGVAPLSRSTALRSYDSYHNLTDLTSVRGVGGAYQPGSVDGICEPLNLQDGVSVGSDDAEEMLHVDYAWAGNPAFLSSWLVSQPSQTQATPVRPYGQPTRTATYSYDTLGRLIGTVRGPGSPGDGAYLRTKLTLDSYGMPSVMLASPDASDTTDSATPVRTVSFTYDADDLFPKTVARTAAGVTLTNTFDYHPGLGVLMTATDPNNVHTAIDHDGFGRAVKIANDDGAFSSVALSTDATHPLIATLTISDVTGTAASSYADRLGRETSRQTTLGATGTGTLNSFVDTVYDNFGRVQSVTRPHASGQSAFTTRYVYDTLGRISSITRDDASHASVQVASYAYSRGTFTPTTAEPCRNKIEVDVTLANPLDPADTDPNASANAAKNVVRRDSITDARGWLCATKTYPTAGGAAAITSFNHGSFDQLTSVRDPAGNLVQMAYDALGRRIQLADKDIANGAACPAPLRRSCIQTAYDAYGQVIRETDAKGGTSTMTFDELGREKTRVTADGTDSWYWDPVNGKGLLASRSTTRSSSTTSYTYNALEQVTHEQWTVDGTAYDYNYTYDGMGRLSQTQYPQVPGRARFVTDRVYNQWGGLDQIRDLTVPAAPKRLASFDTIDVEGHVKQTTLGNLLVTTRSFLPDTGRLQRTTTPAIHDMEYAWYRNGNLRTRTDHRNDNNNLATTRTESFVYDGGDRLSSSNVPGRGIDSYSYDVLGNLTGATEITAAGCSGLVYGGAGYGPHQLAQATCAGTTRAFTYDANGNETYALAPVDREQTWTSFDKQAEVRSQYGRMLSSYDGEHNRIKKEKIAGALSWMTTPVTPAPNDGKSGVWSTTYYVGGGYEKRTSPSVPTIDHVFYVSGVGQMMWRQSGASGTESWRYAHGDVQGTPERTSDANGALVELQSTDAWGARRNPNWTLAGITVPNDTRVSYTGHEHEDEFSSGGEGLVNMGGRTYDTFFKRFTSADSHVPDPTHGPSWNRYSYAANNPLRYVNPSGHDECSPMWCPDKPPPPPWETIIDFGPGTWGGEGDGDDGDRIIGWHPDHGNQPPRVGHPTVPPPTHRSEPNPQPRWAGAVGTSREVVVEGGYGLLTAGVHRDFLLKTFVEQGLAPWDVWWTINDPRFTRDQQVINAVVDDNEESAKTAAHIAEAAAFTEVALPCAAAGPLCRIPFAILSGGVATGHDDVWTAIAAGAGGGQGRVAASDLEMAPRVMGDVDTLMTNAAMVPDESGGFLNVAVHADQHAAGVSTNGVWRELGPEELASEIEGMPQFRGQGVRLLACEAGACPNGLAQRLANRLGVQVWASTKKVWITPSGSWSTPGRWILFNPGK